MSLRPKRQHSTRHFDRSEAKWSEVEKSTINEQPVISTEAERSEVET